MKRPVSIVCCTPLEESWNWFASKFDRKQFKWTFFSGQPKGIFERHIRQPDIAMIRACLQAARHTKRHNADLLITHDPRVSSWCATFMAVLGIRVDHIAHSFNFSDLPRGIKYYWMKWAFSHIHQFIVYSTFEQNLYSEYFGIPIDRIKVVFWSVDVPKFQPEEPIEPGNYICAIGGNSRDYQTLITAIKQLPDIPMVLVARPHNLRNLEVPPNVRVFVDIPFSSAMNILKYSRFTVIPLKGSEVPCGHVTLVAAMHLGKTFIVTDSHGVSDYVHHGSHAIACEPFNAHALAEGIQTLWSNPAKCQQLSKNAQSFAKTYCSEEAALSHLQQLLADRGFYHASQVSTLKNIVEC